MTTIPNGIDEAQVRELLGAHETLLARRERYCTVADLGGLDSVPGPAFRKGVADWNAAHRESIARFNAGSAVIVKSRLVRGALTALQWLAPPPSPEVAKADLAEAVAWCITQLAASGVDAHVAGDRLLRDAASMHARTSSARR